MQGEGSWLWDTPDSPLGCSCREINVNHCTRGQVAAAPGSGQVEPDERVVGGSGERRVPGSLNSLCVLNIPGVQAYCCHGDLK